jgi:polyisoprenoid-binding protein YceI
VGTNDSNEETYDMTIENIGNVGQAAASPAGLPIPTGRYKLHPELTTVAFTAKKLGLFTIRGTVRLQSGSFTVASPPERSTVHAILAAGSFRTPMRQRDEHVQGATLLDVAHYPTIEFDSTEVARRSDGVWEARGLLAVHGQVAPGVLVIESMSQEGSLVHLRATSRVDRRRFGVTARRGVASRVIELQIEAVGVPVR